MSLLMYLHRVLPPTLFNELTGATTPSELFQDMSPGSQWLPLIDVELNRTYKSLNEYINYGCNTTYLEKQQNHGKGPWPHFVDFMQGLHAG